MTPTERAWSIVLDFVGKTFPGLGGERWLVGAIATALTEARAEGFRECQAKAHEVAVRRVVHNPKLDYDAGWNRGTELIANEIKALESND